MIMMMLQLDDMCLPPPSTIFYSTVLLCLFLLSELKGFLAALMLQNQLSIAIDYIIMIGIGTTRDTCTVAHLHIIEVLLVLPLPLPVEDSKNILINDRIDVCF